ncbi:hypothetical protein NJ7G_3681 [Natrinema sp. J7-2]|nr:hypothetical protein NJ7G_3681 [Natrinema sp. J7-2]
MRYEWIDVFSLENACLSSLVPTETSTTLLASRRTLRWTMSCEKETL